tara:strand:- start:992 stop:1189 length:198 start_codon:yes stop_codon:yes gene_type:complete
MPVKFKPSQIIVNRKTNNKKVEHFFIKSTPKKELFDYLNNSSGKPKIKQKCRNELIRRGIKIVYE